MQIDQNDRCPRCGVPFQSLCKLGEPDKRICYICADALQPKADAAPLIDNDLAIQPLVEATHPQSWQVSKLSVASVRRTEERQSAFGHLHIPISPISVFLIVGALVAWLTIPSFVASSPELENATSELTPQQSIKPIIQPEFSKEVSNKSAKVEGKMLKKPAPQRSLLVAAPVSENTQQPSVATLPAKDKIAETLLRKEAGIPEVVNTHPVATKSIAFQRMVEDEELAIASKPKPPLRTEIQDKDEVIKKADAREELRKKSGFASLSDLTEKPSSCPKCIGSGIAIWLECLNCNKSGQPGFKNMGDYWEACRRCSSKGKIAAVRCNTCNGKGNVLLSQLKPADGGKKDPPKGFQWCSGCAGTGTSVWSDCNQCKRSKYPGYLFFGDRLEVCGRCNGAGKFPGIACGKCNNKGVVRDQSEVSKNAQFSGVRKPE